MVAFDAMEIAPGRDLSCRKGLQNAMHIISTALISKFVGTEVPVYIEPQIDNSTLSRYTEVKVGDSGDWITKQVTKKIARQHK